jgi:rhodanese-related sulfurtransferase
MYHMVKEIEPFELFDQLQSGAKQYKLIDIREHNEVASGTVPGAVHIPMVTLPMRTQDLDPDTPTVMICRSGARSAQACMYLGQQGFEKIYNLRGGIMGWARSGLPAALPETA